MEELDLRKARLEKLKKLKSLGINPYPASFLKKQTIVEALKMEGKMVQTAGRIFSFRTHGNIAFADLKDETGKIQIFFQKKLLGDGYKNIDLLDIGDFIGVEGKVVKTIAGEISIAPTSFSLLTKSILPMPNEWFGLKDIETRLRKRYLDLLLHPELREMFRKKAKFWHNIRTYLIDNDFLEVESPVLEPIPGGADAQPFITHHNALDIDLYLRISLELYQKRLLVGGYEKVFEIGRIFRNEGIDAEHLQDYTQMEFYWAYANYEDLMVFLEDLYKTIIKKTFGTLKIKSQSQEIDWGQKWKKLDYFDAFKDATGIDISRATRQELEKKAKELNIKIDPNLGKGRLIDHIYKKKVRPFIIKPSFLIHHPVEVSPLAKRHIKNPEKTQRFQILAYGSELGNGYSELNDPLDQRSRFEEQARLRAKGDKEAQMMDLDFVEALEYGMPPAAGFGLSERLFSFLVDMPMRETVFFPTLRPELNAKQKTAQVKNIITSTSQQVTMTREKAYQLLTKYLSSRNLIKHCLACEAAMMGIYKHLHASDFSKESERQWRITGLLHDIDYELAQKENKLNKHGILLFEKNPNIIPDPIAHAIKAHNYQNTHVDPVTDMDWAITCVDQLTGIVLASALIHSDKKLSAIDAKFVMKRFNASSFAKGASREVIKLCEEKLGIPLRKFIEITLTAMQEISKELGL